MSILDEVFLEEYYRTIKIIKAIEAEQLELPKGSIQRKVIHNVECFYLVYRDGSSIKSKYINKKEIEKYKKLILKRKENNKSLKVQKENLKKLEKVLGKDKANEYSKERIY